MSISHRNAMNSLLTQVTNGFSCRLVFDGIIVTFVSMLFAKKPVEFSD
jgi:hypothetical protein